MKCKWTILTVLMIICFAFTVSAQDLDSLKAEVDSLKKTVAELKGLQSNVSNLEMEVEFQKAMTDDLMSDKMSTEAKSSFRINGFIELRYENMDIKGGEYSTANPSGSAVAYKLWKSQTTGQFAVRNLNVYFDFDYGSKVRSFVEVKFLSLPTGKTQFMFDDRTVGNDGNGSFISFGSTYLERAFVDYKFSDAVKFQMGKFLTPFGIWNVEHGAPVLPSIRVPAVVAYGFFPNNQTGINIHGNKLFGNWDVEYNAWVSNGRGTWGEENYDENKGIGASLNFKAPVKTLNKLVFGAAYYTGKEKLEAEQKYLVDSGKRNSQGETEYFTFYDTVRNKADEYSLCFHLATGYKKLDVNAEFLYNKIKYDNYVGIDNLNYRLFYRPENTSLVDGLNSSMTSLATSLTNLAATYAAGSTVSTFINDTLPLLVLGNMITAQQRTDLTAGLMSIAPNTGTTIMAVALGTANALRLPATAATNILSAQYGNAYPLKTLNSVRKGYYIMTRYWVTPKLYPYLTYEYGDAGDNDVFPPIQIWIFGVNYKPVPVLTFKTEYSIQKFKKEGIATGYANAAAANIATQRNEDFDYFQMSVSYAF